MYPPTHQPLCMVPGTIRTGFIHAGITHRGLVMVLLPSVPEWWLAPRSGVAAVGVGVATM